MVNDESEEEFSNAQEKSSSDMKEAFDGLKQNLENEVNDFDHPLRSILSSSELRCRSRSRSTRFRSSRSRSRSHKRFRSSSLSRCSNSTSCSRYRYKRRRRSVSCSSTDRHGSNTSRHSHRSFSSFSGNLYAHFMPFVSLKFYYS